MKGKRIFAAIDISREAREVVSSYITGLRREFGHLRVGWERTEKLHITVKFAGYLGDDEIVRFNTTAASAARSCPSFTITLTGTGAFMKRGGSNVLWLGIEAEQIAEIASKFEPSLETGKPKSKFDPHLTIARLRQPQGSRDLVDRHLAAKFEPIDFEATELVVYESELLPTGSVYRAVSRHPFGVPK